MTAEGQYVLAEVLAVFISDVLAEDDVSALDVLDALASAGLRLARDEHGHTTMAYQLALGQKS